jgi:predicted transposase YbfD/YdcC
MSLVYNLKGDMTEDELDQQSSNTLRDSLEEHFGDAVDHRRPGSIRHQLIDILFITICAVVSGANDLKAVAMYAKRKQNWLKNVLVLSNGVPSYTTFWTIFVLLSPMPLEQCFVKWVQSRIKEKGISASSASDINIDGKASRGTAKKGEPHSFVHIVSAWAANHHLTLGQLKVDGKSNEITAIPQLLDMIDVAGSTVTIDAMGCQTAIAEKIVDKGGDYVLALKGNQGSFSDEVENYFCQAEDIGFEGVPCDAVGSKDQAHGRIEKREVYATEDVDWLPQREEWKNLKTLIMVKSERTLSGGPTSIERRYYISSLSADALRLANTIRGHWGIESAHWILDIAFREDEQNANAGNIAENMSMIRRLALGLLKEEKTAKCGIAIKRQMAGWDNDYLLKVIGEV